MISNSSTQLGEQNKWTWQTNREKIKIVTLAQLGQLEKMKTKSITLAHLGLAETREHSY